MTEPALDLTACEREPIHIPGSVQPHGMLLVVDRATQMIVHAAGDIEGRLGLTDWQGATLDHLLGPDIAAMVRAEDGHPLRDLAPPQAHERFDLTVHRQDAGLVLELEPAGSPDLLASMLPRIERAARAFEEAADLATLCRQAATEFRRLTGYDRVMVYRFLDDEAGKVVAEDAAPGGHAFLNHHFPATDIPAQARALYVRNLVRVIPDVAYRPAPLRPAAARPLDMSDCALRSVSPIHIQYLRNMGVGASASVSIVKDGVLWGLVACHHPTPRRIPADVRAACRALALSLGQQIKSREETDTYRERVRLRSFEDRIVELLLREGSLDSAIARHMGEIRNMLDADGVAVLRREEVVGTGRCPAPDETRRLAHAIAARPGSPVYVVNSVPAEVALSDEARRLAAGVLAITLSSSEPWVVIWFRAEQVEVVKWAGNPHAKAAGPGGVLTPRASFDAWTETVEGKARRWTIPEVEAAARLATAVTNVWQTRHIRELNRELLTALEQKEALAQQREFLLGEVNHRVQNSLHLVSSFLALQGREADAATQLALEEARRRIAAVSLVHRRLYNSEQIKTIDAARYIDELLAEMIDSLGADWQHFVTRDLEPMLMPTDVAISLGLVLTELVINANKYAYGGAAGPLRVTLSESRTSFRLTVSDQGKGRGTPRRGFGSRMLDAMVAQMQGSLDYLDNQPGTRAVLTAPMPAVPTQG